MARFLAGAYVLLALWSIATCVKDSDEVCESKQEAFNGIKESMAEIQHHAFTQYQAEKTPEVMECEDKSHEESDASRIEDSFAGGKFKNETNLPLCNAAKLGQDEIISKLCMGGADFAKKCQSPCKYCHGNIASETPLHLAAARCHVKAVSILIDNEICRPAESSMHAGTINALDMDGRTPLHRAAARGCDAVVKVLAEKGAKLNEKDGIFKTYTNGNSETPLVMAVKNGHCGVVRTLLEKGANANIGRHGPSATETPLYKAAFRGSGGLVKVFLEAEAKPNYKDMEEPLEAAVGQGHGGIVKLFLDAGANSSGLLNRARYSEPLVKIATEKGYAEIVQSLVDANANVNFQDEERGCKREDSLQGCKVSSALMDAVFKGDEKIVEILLKANADMEVKNWLGVTPLLTATDLENNCKTPLESNGAIVKLLLKAGAKVDYVKEDPYSDKMESRIRYEVKWHGVTGRKYEGVRNWHGVTALIAAAEKGRDGIVQSLVDAKADVNYQCGNTDHTGDTALMRAVATKHEKVVEILLKANANVEVKNKKDETALMMAVATEHEKVVEILLKANANVEVINKKDETALMMAINQDRCWCEVADLLWVSSPAPEKKPKKSILSKFFGGKKKKKTESSENAPSSQASAPSNSEHGVKKLACCGTPCSCEVFKDVSCTTVKCQ